MSLYEYGNTKEMKTSSVKPKAMDLVINQLLKRPHTSSSLIQKIGVYSASHVGRCLRLLKKDGLIGAVKDPKKKALVYYNIGLGAVSSNRSDLASAKRLPGLVASHPLQSPRESLVSSERG